MINISDATKELQGVYDNGVFSLDRWKEYIDREAPEIKDICLNDMEESVSPQYSWKECFLPVLNAVFNKNKETENVSKLFHSITDGLDEKIFKRFGKSVDADIILYLGLCNGAGWVTEVDGKTTILLGIEKILELKWDNLNDMNGLILHELGHVYQNRFGVLYREFEDSGDKFLWQLFTEGIAMTFEQEILEDSKYFHQDRDGWKNWCNQNIKKISSDFENDYRIMTGNNQRYFGDWADYEKHSDVGYYLGTCFVRFVMEKDNFDNIICYDIDDVKRMWRNYLGTVKKAEC